MEKNKSLLYGITASFFFAFTFILNRSMNLSGSYWMWGASLRYIFMLPLLAVILPKKRWSCVLEEIKTAPVKWILWSTVGFGLFYAPLCLGSLYGESWFTASCWQITIIAGILLTPLFGKAIPLKNLLLSSLDVPPRGNEWKRDCIFTASYSNSCNMLSAW